MQFKDKVIIITGEPENLELEIAKMFIKEGASVCYLNEKANSFYKQTIKSVKYQNNFYLLNVNINNYSSVELAVNKILEGFNKVDILINNVSINNKFVEITNKEQLSKALNYELIGVENCILSVTKVMRKENSNNSIINISLITKQRKQYQIAYHIASSIIISNLTKNWAEKVKENIKINAIVPLFLKPKFIVNKKILEAVKFLSNGDTNGMTLYIKKLE